MSSGWGAFRPYLCGFPEYPGRSPGGRISLMRNHLAHKADHGRLVSSNISAICTACGARDAGRVIVLTGFAAETAIRTVVSCCIAQKFRSKRL